MGVEEASEMDVQPVVSVVKVANVAKNTVVNAYADHRWEKAMLYSSDSFCHNLPHRA
jgi:hypothetical protein